MTQITKASCLRIYIDENAHIGPLPIYEAIVIHLKNNGLSGATVFRGVLAYGHQHTPKDDSLHGNWLKDDLPILIETIGDSEKIRGVVPEVISMMKNRGLVTCMELDILHQGSNFPAHTVK